MIAIAFWLLVSFVLYTYLGYPLTIALLARFKSKKEYDKTYAPSVTLLIAAYNEELIIAKKIQNSLALNYPGEKLQILVVTDGSSDRTPEIVSQFQEFGVELAYVPERNGKMAAINRAMPTARSEIVIFSDANNMYDKDAISNLVAPFAESRVGATTGAKLILQDDKDLSNAEGFYWKYESWIKTNETLLGSCSSAVGEILAIRRELFSPPPANIINDDFYQVIDLLRRGYSVLYIPEARSFEYASATVNDETVRRSRITAGRYQAVRLSFRLLPWHRPGLMWQIISHKYFRLLLPFGYLGVLIANILAVVWPEENSPYPLLALGFPFNWLFLGLQFLFYGMAIFGSRIKVGGVLGKALYIPTYLVNSNLSGLRGFWYFVTRRQSHLWARVRRGNE